MWSPNHNVERTKTIGSILFVDEVRPLKKTHFRGIYETGPVILEPSHRSFQTGEYPNEVFVFHILEGNVFKTFPQCQ